MDAAAIEFDFLRNESDLIDTFIKLAETERSLDPEAYTRALANATKGLETLQDFLTRPLKITDEQLDYLNQRYSSLTASFERVSSAKE